jgi:hypothetical protein
MNGLDGKPIIIDGVIADIDEATGALYLDERAREVIAEVLANNPESIRTVAVPVIDLTAEVGRLIEMKHAAGIPVRAPLPATQREMTPQSEPATSHTSPATEDA